MIAALVMARNPKPPAPATPGLDVSVVIAAPASLVLKAFFEPEALHAWWGVVRSVTAPRTLGPYAIEWAPTDYRDDVLGRLGGVFRGTVVQIQPDHGFFLADVYWLPPDGAPIGPMALEVTCTPVGQNLAAGTRVHVVQKGYEESARWRRYYEIIEHGWERALLSLKSLVER